MHGSFALLAASPIWFTIILLEFGCLWMIYWIRLKTEGKAYNPAFSSWLGIQFLIAIISYAAYTLHHATPSGLIADVRFQGIVGCLAVVYAVWRLSIPETPADRWHQTIVMPLLGYLLVTTVPFLWNQGYQQKSVVVTLLGMFAVLVMIDVLTGRSKQRRYMLNKGVRLKGNY